MLGSGTGVPQQVQIPVGLAQGIRELAESQESPVGIHPVGKPTQQHRQQLALNRSASGNPRGQGLDVGEHSFRVAIPDGGQAGLRRGLPQHQRRLRGAEFRHGRQQGPIIDFLV